MKTKGTVKCLFLVLFITGNINLFAQNNFWDASPVLTTTIFDVGIGLSNPYAQLHLFRQVTNNFLEPPPVLFKPFQRFEVNETNIYPEGISSAIRIWDIDISSTGLAFLHKTVSPGNPDLESVPLFLYNDGDLKFGKDVKMLGNVVIGKSFVNAQYRLEVADGDLKASQNVILGNRDWFIESRWWSDGDQLSFCPKDGSGGWNCSNNLTLKSNGNVCIGTQDDFGYRLAVNGEIGCKKIHVEISNDWPPDYVFNNDYKLMTLADLEKFILANKHLPEVPNADELTLKGMDLTDMNLLLLKKVEELTLYIIDLQKQIIALQEKK